MKQSIWGILFVFAIGLIYVLSLSVNIESSKILKEDFDIRMSRNYAYAYWNDERGKQSKPDGTDFSIKKFPETIQLTLEDNEGVIFVEKLPKKKIHSYQKLLSKVRLGGFYDKRPSFVIGLEEAMATPWLRHTLCETAKNSYGFSAEMKGFCR